MSRVASLERRLLAFVVVAAQQVKSLEHRFFGTVGLYPAPIYYEASGDARGADGLPGCASRRTLRPAGSAFTRFRPAAVLVGNAECAAITRGSRCPGHEMRW